MAKQLTLKLSPGFPLTWIEDSKEEIRRLRQQPMRGLLDLDHQISSLRIHKYLLSRKISFEMKQWHLEGCPGYDPERDIRLTEINQEMINLEWITTDLEQQKQDVLRLKYLLEGL